MKSFILTLFALFILPMLALAQPRVGEYVTDQHGNLVHCDCPGYCPPDRCFRSPTEKKAFLVWIWNRRNPDRPQQQTDPAVLQALQALQSNQQRLIELLAAMQARPAAPAAPQPAPQPPTIIVLRPDGGIDPRYTPPVAPDPRYTPPVSPDPRYTPPVSPDPRYTPPVAPDPRYTPPVTPDPRYQPPVKPDPGYTPPIGGSPGTGKTQPSPGQGKPRLEPGESKPLTPPAGFQVYTTQRYRTIEVYEPASRAAWTPPPR